MIDRLSLEFFHGFKRCKFAFQAWKDLVLSKANQTAYLCCFYWLSVGWFAFQLDADLDADFGIADDDYGVWMEVMMSDGDDVEEVEESDIAVR